MKKILFLAILLTSSMIASAQFMVLTTYDGDQVETMDKFTSNLSFGYIINDSFTVGLGLGVKDSIGNSNTNIWGRYSFSMVDGFYVLGEVSTENNDGEDSDIKLGGGYAVKIWKGLYAEPNYTMPINENKEGKREGTFNLTLGYRF